jgi:hypothetical protein
MSTEFEAPGPSGLPTLPPPSPATPPSSVPTAPFLPTPQPVVQAPAPAPVFDAKAMVSAQRRKVENPAYGHMPTGTEEGRAAIEAAKKAMRRRRRRNALLARGIGVVVLAAVAGAGYWAYTAFQDEQDRNPDGFEDSPAPADDGPAAATPLGEQVEVVEALDDLNSGATPSAGGLMDAVDAAEQAMEQNNANAVVEPAAPIELAIVAPQQVIALATPIDPVNGFTRYVIDVDQALYTQRRPMTDWLNALRAMPQVVGLSDPALVPEMSSGELLLAVQSADGVTVDRLVVFGPDQDILIDR